MRYSQQKHRFRFFNLRGHLHSYFNFHNKKINSWTLHYKNFGAIHLFLGIEIRLINIISKGCGKLKGETSLLNVKMHVSLDVYRAVNIVLYPATLINAV